MSSDIVINWKRTKPSREAIRGAARAFFSGAASILWKRDRWYITLPGKPRHVVCTALNSITGPREERWIEVWPDPDGACLYVMTRQQDDYTNALAVGLAGVFARLGGAIEE